jgi:adenylate cyclase
MESMGEDGLIQVTERVYTTLRGRFNFRKREPISVKGKGMMTTYLLDPECPYLEGVGASIPQ